MTIIDPKDTVRDGAPSGTSRFDFRSRRPVCRDALGRDDIARSRRPVGGRRGTPPRGSAWRRAATRAISPLATDAIGQRGLRAGV